MVCLEEKIMTQEISRSQENPGALLDYANRKRKEDRFNDVNITVENETFSANRMVLSCYSDYFDRMFETTMKEKYQDEVVVKEVSKTSMKLIIEFIYTGNIKINKDNVRDLLSTSDMLCVDETKKFCIDFLEMSITTETCFEIFSLAELYRSEILQNRVKTFISENIKKVVVCDDFKKLDLEKMKFILDQNMVPDYTLYKAYLEWTKYDRDNRQCYFSNLFTKVDLSKISSEVLEEDMSNETLICDNLNCLKLLHKEITQRSKLLREGSRSSIYSLGGCKMLRNFTEVFNVSGSTKTTFLNLPLKTNACCGAVLHESLVYLIGGCVESKNNSITNQVYCFDMKKDIVQWDKVASMKVHRQVMGGAVLNGKIFVVGGANENYGQLSSGEYYSSAFNRWANISPMKQERSGNAAVACRDFLYSLGGFQSNNYLNSVERYCPKNDVWDDVPSMKVPRRWLAAVTLNDTHIYAIGGQTSDKTETRQNSVERYDVTTNKWSDVGEMNMERCVHAACVLQGKIYVVGGLGKHDQAVKSIECYDPAADKWTIVGETEDKLYCHALVVL
ncbi:unnamed protein product [Clavelina lepadiformis]|uniref:BTB domain-containing protein n=1 Tax=Clavelina lepadiformis TaxID=159417 RepID=A0ABP0FYF2_CLALP